jgi:DNA polymerase III subunit alpha
LLSGFDYSAAASAIAGSVDNFLGIRQKKYYHLTLIAVTPEGISNLYQLHAWSNRDGYAGGHARIDLERLKLYHKGIVAFTGCMGGPLQAALLADNFQAGVDFVTELVDIMGKENVFIEAMSHGIPVEDRVIIPGLIKVAEYTQVEVIGTNDSHYTNKEDADLHDTYLARLTKKQKDDPTRWKFVGEGYHMAPASEMRAKLDPIFPRACDNTVLLAERIIDAMEGSSKKETEVFETTSAWGDVQGGMVANMMEAAA